jgi:hypothetical protein
MAEKRNRGLGQCEGEARFNAIGAVRAEAFDARGRGEC